MAPRPTEDETLRLPGPWAAVGRDTAAGRALFALYNGFGQARNRGNQYSRTNKIKNLKHIAEHGPVEFLVQKSPPPKKPEVKVPHFYPKNPLIEYYNNLCPVELMRGRRKASEMLERLREDAAIVEVPPRPKGPLFDAKEKARLQEIFYWANRDLGPDPPPNEKNCAEAPKRGSVQEKEMLVNAISKEIEDREAFLTEMEAYGKADKYRSQITAEIQERINQLFMLHDELSIAERAGVQQQCHLATKAALSKKTGFHSESCCPSDCNNITSSSPKMPPSEREHGYGQSFERSSSYDNQTSASSPNLSCTSNHNLCTNRLSRISSPRDTISSEFSATKTQESDTTNPTSKTPKFTANNTHKTSPQNTTKNNTNLTIKVPRSSSSKGHNCNSASARMCSPMTMASDACNGGSNATSPNSVGVDNVDELMSQTPSSISYPTILSTKYPDLGRSKLWREEVAKSRSRHHRAS